MFTRKPRLQLEKFAINGAKRLLQHNLPGAGVSTRSKEGNPNAERSPNWAQAGILNGPLVSSLVAM
jgi:hypothetical protein